MMPNRKPRPYKGYAHVCMQLVLLLLLILPAAAWSQVTQGSIVGTVKDANGAVLPGASVTLTNIDTSILRHTTSNKTGDYVFDDVVPDHYTLSIEAAGFQKWTATRFTLDVRQTQRLDAQMTVGSVQQQVTVNSGALPAIETETPAISGTFSTEMALSLPTNTRASFSGTSPSNIVGTLPGMQNGYMQGPESFFQDVTVDGTSLMFSDTNNGWPSSESIDQIRADGVLVNAEYGDPGEIIATTKSGTNHIHGSAYWYYQSSDFDAIPYTYPITTSKPGQIGNTYGVSAGGPVVIPHLYNGHNKSFFFATYEAWDHPAKSTQFATLPSTEMKQGNFSDYVSSYFPAGSSLVDPNTGVNDGTSIPSVAINPIATSFMSTFYPDPNIGNPADYTDNGVANWESNVNNSANSHQFDVRGDQYFGSNQKFLLWGRFTFKNNGQTSFGGWKLPNETYANQNRVLKIDTNWTISPHLINEGSYAFARNINVNNIPFNGEAWTTGEGFVGLSDLWFNGLPTLSFYNLSGFGQRLNNPGKGWNYVYSDTLLWNKGNHTMKFGGQVETIADYSTLSFEGDDQYGNYQFDNSGSQGLVNPIDFADFLFGVPYSTTYDTVPFDNDGVVTKFFAFAQDSWRVNDRLTLVYGLRYELQPGYHDVHGDIGNFNPATPLSGSVIYPDGYSNIINGPYLASANACDPDGTNNTNSATVNGAPCMPVQSNSQAGLPVGLETHPWLRFMPRIGFAYRPFGSDRTAIRAGFGMYDVTMSGGTFYSLTGTIQAGTVNYTNAYTGPGTAKIEWPNAYSGAGNGGCSNCYGEDYFGTANSVNFKDPYMEQWALSIDHDFGSGYGTRISYIGSETHQLVWAPDENTLPYSTTVSAYDQPLSARLFPNWGTINTRATGADASYHSLQLAANHRLNNGLEFNTEFTWAKSLGDNFGASQGANSAGETGGSRATTVLNPHVDFGNTGNQPRLYWNTTALYDLPFGRGKQFGGSMNRATDLIVGGWRLTSIFTWRTGDFLTPYIPGGQTDPSGTDSGLSGSLYGFSPPGRSQYPDRVAGASVVPANRNRLNYVNVGAFTCPGDPSWAPGYACHTGAGFDAGGNPLYTGPGAEHPLPIGRFGNSQVGSVEGPRYVNLNTGISKSFDLAEGFHLKLEATFTNVLNHTNLTDPNMNITSGSFGYITNSDGARTGQVDARIDF